MKRTLRYLRPYSGTVTAGLVLKLIGALAELFLPFLLEYIIDRVVAVPTYTNDEKVTKIIIYGVLMAVCAFTALFSNIWANRLTVKSSGNMTHDLRYDLFSKISRLSSRQTDSFGLPSLISRLTSDSYYVNQMVARTLRLGVRAPILILGGTVMTFMLDPVLACVLLGCVPLVGLTIFLVTKRSVPAYFRVQKKQDEMVQRTQENVTGVRVIKALSKGDYEVEKFNGTVKDLAAEEFRANRIMSLSNPLSTLILNLGLAAVIAVGAVMGNESGTVLAFLSYFVIILNAMMGLAKIFVVLSRGAASAARIEEVLKEDTGEVTGEYPQLKEGGKIAFDGVCFSYNGVEDNLKDITFKIGEGETLGIIGATGSGKSTLINLMMRFYDVGSGAVYVDGKDVRTMTGGELRKKFGAAFQNDFLMAGSVRDNISYGRQLTDEQILRALDIAQAREFVDGLEGGLDYDLAQKANNLSGGQKQRLLIARAVAANPEILVLDDSSSALDYSTEAALRRELAGNLKGCTKVIVAQRISAVKNADLILVMDDGGITGAGRHEELLQTCPEYALIYEAQMGGV